MNQMLFLQGTVEIFFSFLTMFFSFIIGFLYCKIIFQDIDIKNELKNNIAFGLVVSFFILSIMILVNSAILPVMDVINQINNKIDKVFLFLVGMAIRILIIYLTAFSVSFLVLWSSTKFYSFSGTYFDDLSTLKDNNITVAIVVSTIAISISLILRDPLGFVLSGIAGNIIIDDFGVSSAFINSDLLLNGLIQVFISLVAVITVVLLVFKFSFFSIKKRLNKRDLSKNPGFISKFKGKFSTAILKSSFFLGVIFLMRSLIIPVNELFKKMLDVEVFEFFSVGVMFFKFIISFLIVFLISIVMNRISNLIYDIIVRQKMKSDMVLLADNIVSAMISGVFFIGTSLIIGQGLTLILNSFI